MAKAIVIGAGFGGIASALRLRRKGYDVTLIDKQDQLGGRGYQYRRETPLGTFVHDAGPTVITAKFLFDELFEMFGKRRQDYVEFRDIYPWYRIQFADGSTFNYGGTLEQFEGEIAKFEPRDVEGFRRYLKHSKKIFDVGFTQLGDQPFDQFTTMLKCAPALLRLQNYKTVYGMAQKYITNEKLRRVFSFQPLLVGGNPFNTTSIYSLIFYLEREWGVQFAMGGTGAIVRGLEKLMREEGIAIQLGEEVRRIEMTTEVDCDVINESTPTRSTFGDVRKLMTIHGRDDGVVAELNRNAGDLLVANADAPHVYQHLIDPKYRKGIAPRRLDSMKYSMGLFVMYFGTTRTYPDVAHHTIVLGEAYRTLIDTLFDAREVEAKDLSVYLHRPTATDPSMAPAGCESFYVLVPVPNLVPKKSAKTPALGAEKDAIPLTADNTIDWSKYGDTFREHVIDYLDRTTLPGLRESIVDAFYVTPNHFRDNLNTLHGSGFSIQPIFSQSAYFRFHNKAPGIEGLYFVGAGTHPGAGMPGVLCSAKVLEKLIPDAPNATTKTR